MRVTLIEDSVYRLSDISEWSCCLTPAPERKDGFSRGWSWTGRGSGRLTTLLGDAES